MTPRLEVGEVGEADLRRWGVVCKDVGALSSRVENDTIYI